MDEQQKDIALTKIIAAKEAVRDAISYVAANGGHSPAICPGVLALKSLEEMEVGIEIPNSKQKLNDVKDLVSLLKGL